MSELCPFALASGELAKTSNDVGCFCIVADLDQLWSFAVKNDLGFRRRGGFKLSVQAAAQFFDERF